MEQIYEKMIVLQKRIKAKETMRKCTFKLMPKFDFTLKQPSLNPPNQR